MVDFAALRPIVPIFLGYALSFVYLGIYWNNHHHLFQAAKTVTGQVLWANLHLLFWLSLIPFTTGGMSENHFAPASALAIAIGRDFKGIISLALYALTVVFCLWWPWAALSVYGLVAPPFG